MSPTWKERARELKREVYALYFACRDPRMPWYAKALAVMVVAYAFSPIDLIPDFIPVLGYVDELLLIPLGVMAVRSMTPAQVMEDGRVKALELEAKPTNWTAAAVIVLLWVGLAAACLFVLADCATAPEPAPPPRQEAPPPREVPPPPQAETTAVASLMESARADTAAGRLANAAASLERALRIEPRNARLWHELAQVRLRQRDYAQAASLATRSNSLGPDAALREANQRLIEEARAGR